MLSIHDVLKRRAITLDLTTGWADRMRKTPDLYYQQMSLANLYMAKSRPYAELGHAPAITNLRPLRTPELDDEHSRFHFQMTIPAEYEHLHSRHTSHIVVQGFRMVARERQRGAARRTPPTLLQQTNNRCISSREWSTHEDPNEIRTDRGPYNRVSQEHRRSSGCQIQRPFLPSNRLSLCNGAAGNFFDEEDKQGEQVPADQAAA